MVRIEALALAFTLQNAAASSESAGKERPVMKIVRMCQDMKVELEAELEDDKAVHEKLQCWCETGGKEKAAAIELAEATIAQLEASMDGNVAKMLELKEKRKATLDEVNSDHAALHPRPCRGHTCRSGGA